jgi:hypothetical protein
MIDRLVHHADVIALKGDSYRLGAARVRSRVLSPPGAGGGIGAVPAEGAGGAGPPWYCGRGKAVRMGRAAVCRSVTEVNKEVL